MRCLFCCPRGQAGHLYSRPSIMLRLQEGHFGTCSFHVPLVTQVFSRLEASRCLREPSHIVLTLRKNAQVSALPFNLNIKMLSVDSHPQIKRTISLGPMTMSPRYLFLRQTLEEKRWKNTGPVVSILSSQTEPWLPACAAATVLRPTLTIPPLSFNLTRGIRPNSKAPKTTISPQLSASSIKSTFLFQIECANLRFSTGIGSHILLVELAWLSPRIWRTAKPHTILYPPFRQVSTAQFLTSVMGFPLP